MTRNGIRQTRKKYYKGDLIVIRDFDFIVKLKYIRNPCLTNALIFSDCQQLSSKSKFLLSSWEF